MITNLIGKRLHPDKPFGNSTFAQNGGVVQVVYLDPENPQRGPMVSLQDDEGHFHNKKLSDLRAREPVEA